MAGMALTQPEIIFNKMDAQNLETIMKGMLHLISNKQIALRINVEMNSNGFDDRLIAA